MNNTVGRIAPVLRTFLVGLPRSGKSAIAFLVDLIGFGLCVLSALWLIALGPYAFSHTLIVGDKLNQILVRIGEVQRASRPTAASCLCLGLMHK